MSKVRRPFCKQPLIYILIHLTENDPRTLDKLYQSFRCVLALAGSSAGAPRIPGFGLGVLDFPFLELVPLENVKNNYRPIVDRLEELRSLSPIAETAEDGIVEKMLNDALPFIIHEGMTLSAGRHLKLKLVLITWQNAEDVAKALTKELQYGRALHFASVQVLQISHTGANSHSRSVDGPTGLQIILRNTELTIESFTAVFKEWLQEEPGLVPHITLHLKPRRGDDEREADCLWLDISETSLSSSLLPNFVSNRLVLPTNSVRYSVSTPNNTTVECLQLAAMARVRLCDMSAAWCGGTVMNLLPSVAASLPYLQYRNNSQRVEALHRLLEAEDEALLCSAVASSQPEPKIIVYPSANGTLSANCVVPSELWLPPVCPASSAGRLLPQQVVDRMGALVGALPCASDSTAPTLTATGLVDALLDHKQTASCRGKSKALSSVKWNTRGKHGGNASAKESVSTDSRSINSPAAKKEAAFRGRKMAVAVGRKRCAVMPSVFKSKNRLSDVTEENVLNKGNSSALTSHSAGQQAHRQETDNLFQDPFHSPQNDRNSTLCDYSQSQNCFNPGTSSQFRFKRVLSSQQATKVYPSTHCSKDAFSSPRALAILPPDEDRPICDDRDDAAEDESSFCNASHIRRT